MIADNLDKVKQALSTVKVSVAKLEELVNRIETEERKEHLKSLPGKEGYFDGLHMVTEEGEKVEVPVNYAAKSKLIFGDKLKLIEEEGKQVYKQIDKFPRQKVFGVLTKKEGKWYLISETNTYKISDAAAEFNQAQVNEKAYAVVPEGNLNVPYAALDEIVREKIESLAPSSPVVSAPVVGVGVKKKTTSTTKKKADKVSEKSPTKDNVENIGVGSGVVELPKTVKKSGGVGDKPVTKAVEVRPEEIEAPKKPVVNDDDDLR